MKRLQESSVLSRAERELLEKCRDAVREVAPGAELILYGSRARGDAGLESDYDLLILIDGPVDWQLEDYMRQRLYSLELESGVALSVIAYNQSDWCSPLYRAMPFNQNVEKEGIVL
jgi:predicted nucleotidyltransferase